ncbi:multidrug ABC transporter permease [Sphingomonas spermidinifaciens]|uniref:Multidrug ABC transporter permease n=1 Tax=Sphingomonas spermidinifaciens TaxID=1141889 RepID=A0A2A4B3Z1_9SPHN|nr:HlyD family secretion protein [Sphingomonas spermidinifaciens]PCD02790.1 multidrug ABC transporter permease [Sphingomonas spermidinifaciens]
MAAEATTPDDAGSAPASPARKRRARLIILLLLAAVIVGGLVWFMRYQSYGKFQQSTTDAYVQADSVTVAPKISGYVEEVMVAENQSVKAGDPLVRIDARDYDAQARQSEAQIAVAQANARGVEAQIAEQQAAITRARADLAAAETDAAFARSEVARYAPLAETGAETRERVSTLRNQAQQASARVVAARAALAAAERRVGTLRAQVAQALAQGEGARAQLAAAQTNVGATLIRASIAGRIGDKTVRVGQFVQGGTRLMSVVPTTDLYIEANFKETQLGLMRVGQPVKIEVDALPGVEIPGRVASIAPGTGAQFSVLPPQNATGNFTKIVQRIPVRIALNPGPATRALLVPGMSVEVSVDTRSARDAADRIAKEQEAHNERIGRK